MPKQGDQNRNTQENKPNWKRWRSKRILTSTKHLPIANSVLDKRNSHKHNEDSKT